MKAIFIITGALLLGIAAVTDQVGAAALGIVCVLVGVLKTRPAQDARGWDAPPSARPKSVTVLYDAVGNRDACRGCHRIPCTGSDGLCDGCRVRRRSPTVPN